MHYKYGKRTREFWGAFYSHFSLVFHDFEGFLIKQFTRLVGYLSFHVQRALVE